MFPTAIGCETPEVQNGKVYELQSSYRAGESLHFDCNAGFAAEDSYEAQCQPGGTWDPPVLRCERGECGWVPAGGPACGCPLQAGAECAGRAVLPWALTHHCSDSLPLHAVLSLSEGFLSPWCSPAVPHASRDPTWKSQQPRQSIFYHGNVCNVHV